MDRRGWKRGLGKLKVCLLDDVGKRERRGRRCLPTWRSKECRHVESESKRPRLAASKGIYEQFTVKVPARHRL